MQQGPQSQDFWMLSSSLPQCSEQGGNNNNNNQEFSAAWRLARGSSGQCEVTRGVARRFCPTRAHSKQLSARRGGQGLIYVDDDDIGDDDDDDDVNDFVDGDMPSP